MRPVAVTGIKPTGTPHLGNWLGAIEPALARAQDTDAFFFVADYHALTSVRDPEALRRSVHEVAATWLAFGLDPDRSLIYRQSDVPEVFELAWILACHAPKGFMNKSHAYKAIVQRNQDAGMPSDNAVNMGLFTYPLLMAADILIMDADEVPVGKDQVQHVEIARDIAERINGTYGEGTLKLPAVQVRASSATLTGSDGRKMSKSYDNTIPCFETAKRLRKQVMRIVTDSVGPDDPKDPDGSAVFAIHAALLDDQERHALAADYREGIAWGDAKQRLWEALEARLEAPRRAYDGWMSDRAAIDALLAGGADRARQRSRRVLDRVREAIGI